MAQVHNETNSVLWPLHVFRMGFFLLLHTLRPNRLEDMDSYDSDMRWRNYILKQQGLDA